jgi:hypothetical protein
MQASVDIVPNVISIIKPLSNLSVAYQSMWAFGNHLRVANTKHHLSAINSRVVTTFEQECHSHSNDQNPMLASLEYILGGWKKSWSWIMGGSKPLYFFTTRWWQIIPNL